MVETRWFRRPGERHFRWRSEEVSRVEGLSDAVFALTLTLLAVTDISLSGADLLQVRTLWPHFVTLGLTFAMLAWIWNCHFLFFRRYGLRDGWSRTLNYFLLFLVLCYAYPLKALFAFLVEVFCFGRPWRPPGEFETRAQVNEAMAEVMIVYSLGLCLIFAVFALLYRHAWKLRDELELDPVERHTTRTAIQAHLLVVAIATASILMAALAPGASPLAGMVYFLVGPVLGVHGWIRGRKHGLLVEELAARGQPAAAGGS